MTRIEFAPQVLDEFDRFLDHMVEFEVEGAATRIDEIVQAIDILDHSPLIGRPVKGGKREFIVGQAARGYVVMYRYVVSIDTVFVLAIRSQREDGYRPNW